MNRLMKTAAILVVALVTFACGDSPTAPGGGGTTPNPTPTSVSFRVVDGLTGSPVSGATVKALTFTGTTDSSGQVILTGVGLGEGVGVTLTANGYLTYETSWTATRQKFGMWPVAGENKEVHVREMVYGLDTPGINNFGITTASRLNKAVTIVLPSNMPEANVAQWTRLAPEFQAVIGYPVSVGTVAVSGTTPVSVTLNTSLPVLAQAEKTLSAGIISACNISMVKWVNDNTVLHELGHCAGAYHHSGKGVLGQFNFDGPAVYYQMERDNITMLYRSAPLTREVHNDRGLLLPAGFRTTTSSEVKKQVVVCERPHL